MEDPVSRIYEDTLLFDFYGELLTEKQKETFNEIVFNDYSLAEAADEQGISRQGVHDNLKHAREALYEYENKLHLVEKFLKIKKKVNRIASMTDDGEIHRIADEILKEL